MSLSQVQEWTFGGRVIHAHRGLKVLTLKSLSVQGLGKGPQCGFYKKHRTRVKERGRAGAFPGVKHLAQPEFFDRSRERQLSLLCVMSPPAHRVWKEGQKTLSREHSV